MKEYLDSRELISVISAAGLAAGLRRRDLGTVECAGESFPVIALSRRHSSYARRLLLTAGIHGDEPAGPHAVLTLLRELPNDWPELAPFHLEIVPLINPTGFDRRMRANWQGIDLNRTFGSPRPPAEIRALMDDYRRRRADLSVDFHEDVDTPGFYMYELAPAEPLSLGRPIIKALKTASLPVNTGPVIEGMPADDGLILRTSRPFPRFFRQGSPQGLYMKRLGTPRTLTLETPPSLPLEKRVAMHLIALRTAVRSWAEP